MLARLPSSNLAGFLPVLIVFAALAWVCPSRAEPLAAICGPDRCTGPAPFLPLRVQALRGAASTPGDFNFYVLSLSWSSGFCATPAGARARGQCNAGADLGFVVHGLWPQYEHGYPSDCGPAARFPSRMALLSPPRRNRPGRRSISRALSSRRMRGCGRACWGWPAQAASYKR
jgi:hypothetical protein